VASEEHFKPGEIETKMTKSPKTSELVMMLSTTTSISTRSPTASSKKTLKVVVVRSCVDLKICKNLYKNNKIKKHPRVPKDHHISSLKAL